MRNCRFPHCFAVLRIKENTLDLFINVIKTCGPFSGNPFDQGRVQFTNSKLLQWAAFPINLFIDCKNALMWSGGLFFCPFDAILFLTHITYKGVFLGHFMLAVFK